VLLLFDIDGTLLLKATRAHAQAVVEAVRAVYNPEERPEVKIEAAGRTDLDIARQLALLGGVSPERFDAGRDDFRAAAVEAYARLCEDDLSAHVAPGVTDVLEALAARDGVRLAVLTGNLEPIAHLKLARAGLGGFFERGQGGFGSDEEDRALLPAIARARAGGWPRERTVVIGDTPRDIACARADGVRVIAVATGPFSAKALADADAVVDGVRAALPVLADFATG
jgi:phosphoglycolate phosphatase-like HAD superfamily hydrolase